MACFAKTAVRVGVITALAGGVAVLVAGPHRVHAVATQARSGINDVIDRHIDDPVALRDQIKRLEAEYPKKIAEVRSDLAEVSSQVAQINRELAVSQKVVELASLDLSELDGQLTQGRMAQSDYPNSIVRVSFNNSKMTMPDAYAKREQIQQTRQVYAGRAADMQTDLTYLTQQEAQLADLLTRLETERAEFQAKIFQLDAQIDTIARNERLIDMMAERQKTIDRLSRYESHSLEQFSQKISTKLEAQRAELEAIAGREADKDYVNEAEYLLDQNGGVDAFESGTDAGFVIEPQVIDVDPTKKTGPMASSH